MPNETTTSDTALDRARRRTTGLFLTAVSAGSTGLIAAVTVTTLVARNITGSAIWSGVPMAAVIFGTAAGAVGLAEAMQRWGRRPGLAAAYLVGAFGSMIAVAATVVGSFSMLVLGAFVLGVGHSANTLTRYLAADLYAPRRRAAALSWVVWAGTIGAVVGPNLLATSGRVVEGLGLPHLSGAYVAAAILFGLVSLVAVVGLRPDPLALMYGGPVAPGELDSGAKGSLEAMLGMPRVQIALSALITGQVVMVLIMTMTPLHLQAAGYSLDGIGLVMSAHIVGMFALSPLTGRLVSRFGPISMILVGQGMLLAAACNAALMPTANTPLVMAVLFLLGLGWNFGFVGGSTLLSSGLSVAERPRIQGRADSMVWVSAATASLVSSLVLAVAGFTALCVIGATLVAAPVTVIVWRARDMRGVEAESVEQQA